MRFTVALLQIAPHGNDQSRNLEKGLNRCREARSVGADLAVFPELWNVGSSIQYRLSAAGRESWAASAIDRGSDFFLSFTALAQELRMNIALTYLEAHSPKPRNSVSIINRSGEVVLNYSKVFICDFGEAELLKHDPNPKDIGCDVNCSPGESFEVCVLDGAEGEVRVGAMICADREFPEPAHQLMRNGAELIVVPNACSWDDVRAAGLRTRAFENLVGVAMVNYPMPLNNGESQAYTCVPWKDGKPTQMLVAKADEQEQILLATFDVDEIRTFRNSESWVWIIDATPPTLSCGVVDSCISSRTRSERRANLK
jgi:predicted amidohydrolase